MTIRLVKAYRGYKAGEQLDVPDQLADRLVRARLAERIGQDLFQARRPGAERAVATAQAVETRSHR